MMALMSAMAAVRHHQRDAHFSPDASGIRPDAQVHWQFTRRGRRLFDL